MENEKELIDVLKAEVLQHFGEIPQTSADFEKLFDSIRKETNCPISTYTLKRLFGKITYDSSPAINTLSTLARYVGFKGWTDFVASHQTPTDNDEDSAPKRRCTHYHSILWITLLSLVLISVTVLPFFLKGGKKTDNHEITGTLVKEGDTLSWVIDRNTWTLTISGKGRMRDFQHDNQPEAWLAYRDSLRSVIVDEGITSLGDYAFYKCAVLSDVTLPSSLKTIGDGAFNACFCLSLLKLPDGLESLGACVFKDCLCLQEMVIPGGITEIRYELFARCYVLKSCTFLGPVTFLERFAFDHCRSLQHIELPSSLMKIGDCCFEYCDQLQLIECHAECAPYLDVDVFKGVPSTVKLVHPQGADYSSWKKAILQ